jgi:hypothetical protein
MLGLGQKDSGSKMKRGIQNFQLLEETTQKIGLDGSFTLGLSSPCHHG